MIISTGAERLKDVSAAGSLPPGSVVGTGVLGAVPSPDTASSTPPRRTKVVYKHAVPIDDQSHELWLPPDANVVHVGVQRNTSSEVMVWFERAAAPARDLDLVVVRVFGTGQDTIPGDATHLGSVIDGWLVWHVYQLERRHAAGVNP